VIVQSLAGTDDNERSQSQCIEVEQEMPQGIHPAVKEKNRQGNYDRKVEIGLVFEYERRRISQEQVAQGASAGSGYHAEHQHTEQVHVAADAGKCAGSCKSCCAEQVQAVEQGHCSILRRQFNRICARRQSHRCRQLFVRLL